MAESLLLLWGKNDDGEIGKCQVMFCRPCGGCVEVGVRVLCCARCSHLE